MRAYFWHVLTILSNRIIKLNLVELVKWGWSEVRDNLALAFFIV